MVKSNDIELTYSFDNGKDYVNLRILTDTQEEIMSISVIYSYSFLYENEIKELFGVKIKDISIDFNDQLYQIPVKTPFNLKKEEE
jgi:ech hydrogenase subunit D